MWFFPIGWSLVGYANYLIPTEVQVIITDKTPAKGLQTIYDQCNSTDFQGRPEETSGRVLSKYGHQLKSIIYKEQLYDPHLNTLKYEACGGGDRVVVQRQCSLVGLFYIHRFGGSPVRVPSVIRHSGQKNWGVDSFSVVRVL